MTSQTAPRPDLAAHRHAVRKTLPEIATALVRMLGRKLTAYTGGATDARAVDQWMERGSTQRDIEMRLRFTYQVASMLSEHDGPRVVQAWFIGLNPDLDDYSPLRYLREQPFEIAAPRVLGAARAFLAGG